MSARALLVLALLLVPASALAQVEMVVVSHEGPSERADRARLRATAFARCNEPGASDAPELVVRLVVAIARDGQVASVTLAPNPETAPPEIESVRECVVEQARGLRFARGEIRHVELLVRARRAADAAPLDALEGAALAAIAPAVLADAAPSFADPRVPSVSRARVQAVTGPLTRAVLERVLARHGGEVNACYEHTLASRGALTGEGEIEVQFVIGPDGTVPGGSIATDEVGEAEVAGCILRAFRSWPFPAPDGGSTVQARAHWIFHHREAPPHRLPRCSGGGCGY